MELTTGTPSEAIPWEIGIPLSRRKNISNVTAVLWTRRPDIMFAGKVNDILTLLF
jgi:hypothetical protein